MGLVATLEVQKSFTYQGATRLWSNKIAIGPGHPTDFAHWSALAAAVIDAEKLIYPSSTHIVKAVGTNDGEDIPIYTEVFSVAGTLAVTGGSSAPGDCAILLRYGTGDRGSTNHPIFGFSYFHGAVDYDSGSGHPDGWLYEPQKAAVETYADAWLSGFSDGTATFQRYTAGGSIAVNRSVDQWIRHRDFPR